MDEKPCVVPLVSADSPLHCQLMGNNKVCGGWLCVMNNTSPEGAVGGGLNSTVAWLKQNPWVINVRR